MDLLQEFEVVKDALKAILSVLEANKEKLDRLLAVGSARQTEEHICIFCGRKLIFYKQRWICGHGCTKPALKPKTEKKDSGGEKELPNRENGLNHSYGTGVGKDLNDSKLPEEATTNFALPMTGKYQWYRLKSDDKIKLRKCSNEGCLMFLKWSGSKEVYEHWKYDANTGKGGYVQEKCDYYFPEGM